MSNIQIHGGPLDGGRIKSSENQPGEFRYIPRSRKCRYHYRLCIILSTSEETLLKAYLLEEITRFQRRSVPEAIAEMMDIEDSLE